MSHRGRLEDANTKPEDNSVEDNNRFIISIRHCVSTIQLHIHNSCEFPAKTCSANLLDQQLYSSWRMVFGIPNENMPLVFRFNKPHLSCCAENKVFGVWLTCPSHVTNNTAITNGSHSPRHASSVQTSFCREVSEAWPVNNQLQTPAYRTRKLHGTCH